MRASSASSSPTLTCRRRRVSITSSAPRAGAARVEAAGRSGAELSTRSRVPAPGPRRPSATAARSRSQAAIRARPRSSASVRARRAARLVASSASRERRRAPRVSPSPARRPSPSKRACAASAACVARRLRGAEHAAPGCTGELARQRRGDARLGRGAKLPALIAQQKGRPVGVPAAQARRRPGAPRALARARARTGAARPPLR